MHQVLCLVMVGAWLRNIVLNQWEARLDVVSDSWCLDVSIGDHVSVAELMVMEGIASFMVACVLVKSIKKIVKALWCVATLHQLDLHISIVGSV